jgi:hypothetical protein
MTPSPRRCSRSARGPMQRDRGQCFIQVEAAVVDRMRAMRRPGESCNQVIVRLVELETGPPQTVVPRTPIAAAGNVSKGRIAPLRRSPREGPESALKHAYAFIGAPATGATGGERSFVDRGKDVALNSRGIARARGAIGSGDGAKCPSLGSHTLKAREQEPCSPSQQAGARPPDSGLQDRRGRSCRHWESPRPSNAHWP